MEKFTTTKQIKDLYRKYFYVAEEQLLLIDAFIGIYVASRLAGDPIWFMLVGAPSMGKTEFINILSLLPHSYMVSTLTENTFLSSARGGAGASNSLLHKIGPKGLLIMKDFTTILAMRPEKRDQILAQMREIFDGKITKESGNGNSQSWIGKICLIAAVTDAIYDNENGESAGMGRRSIMYELPNLSLRKREEMGVAANTARQNIDAIRKELQEKTAEVCEHLLNVELARRTVPRLNDEQALTFIRMSNFVTAARTGVSRDFKGNLLRANSPEGPARFASQLVNLSEMMMFVRGEEEMSPEVLKFAFKVGMDSIPQQRRHSLYVLGSCNMATAKAVAIEIKLPTGASRAALEELNAHDIIERKRAPSGVGADRWLLKDDYREMMKNFAGIESNGKDLLLEDDDTNEVSALSFNASITGNDDLVERQELQEARAAESRLFTRQLSAISVMENAKHRYPYIIKEIKELREDVWKWRLDPIKEKVKLLEEEKALIEAQCAEFGIRTDNGELLFADSPLLSGNTSS